MQQRLSAAKATILAAHLAAAADVQSLYQHLANHHALLSSELSLRIILTYLPETVDPTAYIPILERIKTGDWQEANDSRHFQLNHPVTAKYSEVQARKEARRLHLLQLSCTDASVGGQADNLTLFLFRRSHKLDEDADLLHHVPTLLAPFLNHSDCLRDWYTATVLPLSRRNFEYYPTAGDARSLAEFQSLSDELAIDYLLSEIDKPDATPDSIIRDLRGLLGPWLYSNKRWTAEGDILTSRGWNHFLRWLVQHASHSCTAVVQIIEHWTSLQDADFGLDSHANYDAARLRCSRHAFLQASLAAAYSIGQSTPNGLVASFHIVNRVKTSLDDRDRRGDGLDNTVEKLPTVSDIVTGISSDCQAASNFRKDMLNPHNPFTSPDERATCFLEALIVSARILTRSGQPYTARMAGEIMLHADLAEQKGELLKLIRQMASNAPRNDDTYWVLARRSILWLHDWSTDNRNQSVKGKGVFGILQRYMVEAEILKAMLATAYYGLARSIYDCGQSPLTVELIQEAVLASALNAFDNASNPDRTRGNLKVCDDILGSMPQTVPPDVPGVASIRSLLKATHGLSSYRLVLKEGEPFRPVVLRVHSDPISIIERVLDQNSSGYTRINEFVEMSQDLVAAAAVNSGKQSQHRSRPQRLNQLDATRAEKRVIAMCIEAALREDDFETAYSYIMSRTDAKIVAAHQIPADPWSWMAAFRAGQYTRTPHSRQPTHLGTSSGNPEVRHLEQRLECLAIALKLAPSDQMVEVLKIFRRCEEQLDSVIIDEAAQEQAWEVTDNVHNAPGSFETLDRQRQYPPRNMTATAAVHQGEEAPMSLFDLSRATANMASRSLGGLTRLPTEEGTGLSRAGRSDLAPENRVRKRDQLREAATGTLVSGVGWLIGANAGRQDRSTTT